MAPALTIDWAKIPRIILVDNPDTEIIQQDIIDELRTQESNIHNTDKDAILDGDGKQVLDTAGNLVGITNTLLSALLGFDADTTAKSQGTATTADPLGLTLKDVGATFQTDGVLPGAVIINFDDYSVSSVIEVISQTEILHRPLADGTLNTWVIGNNYKIWNIKQGVITGGNLVAVDVAGDPVATPIYPTPFTQVILATSSSATLQEIEAIQQNVYGEKATLSATNPKRRSGTVYPAGTHEFPSDNLADAKAIALERGFEKLHFDSDWTLGATDVVSGLRLIGMGFGVTTVTVVAGCATANTVWDDMTVVGAVNGIEQHFNGCTIGALTGVRGTLHSCLLAGNFGVAGPNTEVVQLLNCWSAVPGLGTPEVDMNGDGPGLSVRGYNGGIQLNNKTGSSKVSIDMQSGQIILDGTVTVQNLNDIVLRGNGKPTINAVNPQYVNLENLLDGRDIKRLRHQGAIWIDTVNGTAGTEIGKNGTPENPVTTLADALILATATGLRCITMISGNLVLTSALTEFLVELRDESEINFGGQSVNGSEFFGGVLKGGMTGTVTIRDSSLEDASGLVGHVRRCGLEGTIALGVGTTSFDRCHSHVPGISTPTLDLVGAGRLANMRAYSGGINVENMTDPTNVVTIEFVAGQAIVDSSCSDGLLVLRGNVEPITRNETGTVVNTEGVVSVRTIWAALLVDHNLAGSFGGELATKADLAASASTTYLPATSATIIFGTEDAGDWTAMAVRDGVYWEIGEDGANGITVEMVFNLTGANCRPGVFSVFGRYTGNPSIVHYQDLFAWNYEASAWEQLVEEFMPGGMASDQAHAHEYFERHIDRDNNNEVKIRIVHNVTTYNATHALFLDQAQLSCIVVVTAADIALAVWARVLDGNSLGLTAEETVDLTRKILNNRLELAEGSVDNWILYNDDDSTVLLEYNVTDKSGAAITIPTGAPARRTRGVAP